MSTNKMYHAESVVAYFVQKNGGMLDPMKANKLAYIAYGYTLAILNKKLFYYPIEAWPHGPIVTNLIYRTQTCERKRWPVYYRMLDSETTAILNRIWDVYVMTKIVCGVL